MKKEIAYFDINAAGIGTDSEFFDKLNIPLPFADASDNEDDLTPGQLKRGIISVLTNEPAHPHATEYREILLRISPEIVSEICRMTRAFIEEQRYEEAQQQLNSALGIVLPDSDDSRYVLLHQAYCYESLFKYYDLHNVPDRRNQYKEQARRIYDELVSGEPTSAICYQAGNFFGELYDYPAACDVLSLCLDATNGKDGGETDERQCRELLDYYKPLRSIASVENAISNGSGYTEALEHLRSFIEENPRNARGWGYMAMLLTAIKREPQALQAAVKAVELGEENERFILPAAVAVREMGLYAETVDLLKQMLANAPESLQVMHQLGVTLCEEGSVSEGKRYLAAISAWDPDYKPAISYLKQLDERDDG